MFLNHGAGAFALRRLCSTAGVSENSFTLAVPRWPSGHTLACNGWNFTPRSVTMGSQRNPYTTARYIHSDQPGLIKLCSELSLRGARFALPEREYKLPLAFIPEIRDASSKSRGHESSRILRGQLSNNSELTRVVYSRRDAGRTRLSSSSPTAGAVLRE